jgi:hypothetical protein
MNDIFLTDKITIVSTSYDEWGKLSTIYASGRPARVEYKQKIVHDKDGKEMMSNMQVFLGPDEQIKYEDKIRIDSVAGVVSKIAAKEFVIKAMDQTHGFTNFAIEVSL